MKDEFPLGHEYRYGHDGYCAASMGKTKYLVPIFGVNIPENFREETSVLECKPAEGRERNPGMRPASANT